MLPKSLSSLVRRTDNTGRVVWAAVLGSLAGLSTPLLALLLSSVLHCLISATAGHGRAAPYAVWLPDIGGYLPTGLAPLAKVAVLLGIALTVLLFVALVLFLFYRQLQVIAVALEVNLFAKLRQHAKQLATTRTLSAQQQALTDGLDYHLPRVRASLGRWWRTFPRHVVQLLASIVAMVLIQPTLALLTGIATGLAVLVYRLIDKTRRTSLPVVRERAAQHRGELVDFSLQGPLLETVHENADVERRFSEQLAHYQRDAVASLTSSAWRVPLIVLFAGALGCLFVFVLSVQLLGTDAEFGVAGAFGFTLCGVASGISLTRILHAVREVQAVEGAAQELERFLTLPVEDFEERELATITRITEYAAMEHVTVQDSNGRKLLEDVSTEFKPGRLIGVVASQPIQARALVELLMGFGRPVSGRMLVDGQDVCTLDPAGLAQCVHWVAADGALVTGTVKENLLGAAQIAQGASTDLSDTLKSTKLLETVGQLPDGLATIVTPGDDRLRRDASFRLGLARAALRQASVLVIQEPKGGYDPESEKQTLDAMRSLVAHSSITVVLPQRLLTLRQCDLVIMLHDHRVADTGTHAELLQRNELYRHLNYLKFNPFRGGDTGGDKG